MDSYFVWTPWGNEPEDKYPWKIFSFCDGVLISKGYVNPKLEESIVKHGGIQNFLRWNGPIICDSGVVKLNNQRIILLRQLNRVLDDIVADKPVYATPNSTKFLNFL